MEEESKNKYMTSNDLYEVEDFEEREVPKKSFNKKIFFILGPLLILLLILIIVLLVITGKTPGLEKKRYQMEEGSTLELKTKASKAKLTFTSSDTSKATVDNNGIVEAKAPGFVKIKVKHDLAKEEVAIIEIKEKAIDFTFKETSRFLTVGQSIKLDNPGGYQGEVKWTINDTDIASIYNNILRGQKIGKTILTATAGKYVASQEIVVGLTKDNKLIDIYVKPVVVSRSEKDKYVDVSTNPEGLNINMTYEVEDQSILKVEADGKIVPIKKGKTYLTVRAPNGVFKKVTVEVQ